MGCVCAVQSCRVSAGMWREVNRVFGGTEKETKTKEKFSVENAVKENEEMEAAAKALKHTNSGEWRRISDVSGIR